MSSSSDKDDTTTQFARRRDEMMSYRMRSATQLGSAPLWRDTRTQQRVSARASKIVRTDADTGADLQDKSDDLDDLDDLDDFDEEFLLSNYEDLKFHDLQGSHWAPHIIHKKLWDRIGGFSEEFNPGFGSDPDLNMKLWNVGVRIFKAVNKSRVYHFGSLTTRKNKDIKRNDGRKTFLLKWKITMNYFIKYYLNRGKIYDNPLPNHKLSFSNFVPYLLSKLKYYIKIINGK